MPDFKNVKQLHNYLQDAINDVLGTDMLKGVVQVAQIMGDLYVYKAYGSNITGEPNIYVRRKLDGGGLLDKENFIGTIISPGTLEVKNVAKPNAAFPGRHKVKDLAQLVEYGDGRGGRYSYKKGADTFGDFNQARPFMRATQKEFDLGNATRNFIVEKLEERGLTFD